MNSGFDETARGHRLASREEWLRARLELLREEKALTRRSDDCHSGRFRGSTRWPRSRRS